MGAPFGSFGALAADRKEMLLRDFGGLPDEAFELKVDAVLVAGDLFDSPRPDDRVVAVAHEFFRRLIERGVPAFVVPGNHDPLSDRGALDEMPDEIHVFREPVFGDPVSVETSGGALHVYGIAHDPLREPDPAAGFVRAPNHGVHVALLHASMPAAPNWKGGHTLRLSAETIGRLDVDYLALGDWHQHRTPGDLSGAGELPACYPGSFAALDLTESGAHGYVVADLDAGAAPTITLHPSGLPSVMELERLDVSRCSCEREVADSVADALRAETDDRSAEAYPVVTLCGELEFPLDAAKVGAMVAERFGAARVKDDAWYFSSERLRELAGENTIPGHVARLGAEGIAGAGDAEERRLLERALRLALRHLEVT